MASVILTRDLIPSVIQILLRKFAIAISEEKLSGGEFAVDHLDNGFRLFLDVKVASPAFDKTPSQEQRYVCAAVLLWLACGKVSAIVPACIIVLYGRP